MRYYIKSKKTFYYYKMFLNFHRKMYILQFKNNFVCYSNNSNNYINVQNEIFIGLIIRFYCSQNFF